MEESQTDTYIPTLTMQVEEDDVRDTTQTLITMIEHLGDLDAGQRKEQNAYATTQNISYKALNKKHPTKEHKKELRQSLMLKSPLTWSQRQTHWCHPCQRYTTLLHRRK